MPALEVDAVLAEFTDDVALAEEVVRLRANAVQAEHDRDRYFAALSEIDQMDPEDYKVGQDHLPPAFRQPDLKAGFRQVCRIVNGVLHGTDEYGKALPDA